MPFDNQAYLEPAADPAADHNHILDEMKRVLDERGWCKGTLQDGRGRVCLRGALAVVLTGNPWETPSFGHPTWMTIENMAFPNAIDLNNDPTTTRADIDKLLEKARL